MKTMRNILTQHYTIEHKEMFDLTSPINKAFAEKNGFEYITSDIKRCPDRQVWWEKIAWLIELLSTLEDGTLVVYEDCDAVNVKGDLKAALHEGFEYGMVHLRGGFDNSEIIKWFNAGVIIMLNTPSVRSFLQRVWDRNDDTDETSINKEIKHLNDSIGSSKPVCSLGVEWNCWSNNKHLSSEACIRSWHGMKYADKVVAIKEFISTIT